jgi:hydrogenase-4 component E
MISLADQLLVLVLLINFISLGTSRLIFSIRAVAAQGVILGILPGLIHPFSWHLVFRPRRFAPSSSRWAAMG